MSNLDDAGPPICITCNISMQWSDVQRVDTPSGEKPMNIFRCEACGKLAASEATEVIEVFTQRAG